MSGLVQHAMKLARAINFRYSVQSLGSGVAGQSVLVKTIPDWHGVGVGLQSAIPARSSSVLIVVACDMCIVRAAGL